MCRPHEFFLIPSVEENVRGGRRLERLNVYGRIEVVVVTWSDCDRRTKSFWTASLLVRSSCRTLILLRSSLFWRSNFSWNKKLLNLAHSHSVEGAIERLTFASRNSITCTRNSDDCLLKSISFFSYASLILISFCRSISCAFTWELKLQNYEWNDSQWGGDFVGAYSKDFIRAEKSRSLACRSAQAACNWSRSTWISSK